MTVSAQVLHFVAHVTCTVQSTPHTKMPSGWQSARRLEHRRLVAGLALISGDMTKFVGTRLIQISTYFTCSKPVNRLYCGTMATAVSLRMCSKCLAPVCMPLRVRVCVGKVANFPTVCWPDENKWFGIQVGFTVLQGNVNDEILAAMVVVVHEIILSNSRRNVWSNPKSGM